MKRRLVAVSGFLFGFGLFASAASIPLPEGLRAVNVFSGIPMADDDNPNKTGGFGDVAVNLVMAVELKSRYPKLRVRLLVTSLAKRDQPQIPTSNEIIKIMVPDLNPELKQTPQIYRGVEVVFLDYDIGLLFDTKALKLPYERVRDDLPQLVPPADLNLNFSHYVGGGAVVRIGAPVALAFEEQFGGRQWVKESEAPQLGQGAFLTLSSGPGTAGYVLSEKERPRAKDLSLIRNWLASQGKVMDTPFDMAFAYTSEWQSTQIYIDTISALGRTHGTRPLVLLIKKFSELDLSDLPDNVHVIQSSAVPHDVMAAMIWHSTVPPLVTGDTSLGLALSSTTPTKTFAYEAPPWKNGNAGSMKQILTERAGVGARKLDAMFLYTQKLADLTREDLRRRGKKLARLFDDTETQTRLYHALESVHDRWDLLGNALRIYRRVKGKTERTALRDAVTSCAAALALK